VDKVCQAKGFKGLSGSTQASFSKAIKMIVALEKEVTVHRNQKPQKGGVMPKRILWVSRHSMHGVQMGALRRLFGDDVEVTEDTRPFDNAETVVKRIRQGGYDDCIVVAPYSVLNRMVQLGLRPLYSEAEIVDDPDLTDWEVKGRKYRFMRFRRVKKLVLELEDLGPDAERRGED
jgi:hypothetical protein